MTAPRATVEMKRVTLLRCKWCGAIAAKRGSQFIVLVDGDATRDCADGGREVHHPEPIEYAPLPSESDRDEILEALRAWNEELADRLSQAWSGK